MKGLLVDLEIQGPDSSRYVDLRDTFLNRLAAEVPEMKSFQASLDYVHFSAISMQHPILRHLDFVLLSPQGTPWHAYRDGASEKLELCKTFLKEMIYRHRTPVIGICGGHQFLALTFGGSVDFIDPSLKGRAVESYPRGAIAERGIVQLETLAPDPIFDGLVNHPGMFWVMQNHYEEVKTIPEPLINLARSSMSEIQLIRIPEQVVYGVAFHPERGLRSPHEPASPPNGGIKILANFMKMVISAKQLKGIF